MKKKLLIGVVGLGVGYYHFNFLRKLKKCKLISVCDTNQKKLDLVKKNFPKVNTYKSFDLMIKKEKLDLVCVASYDNYHSSQILKLINKKINIFVEKPMCLNYKEYFKIKSSLNVNNNVKFSSNLVLRNSPQFRVIEKKINLGEFKNIFYIQGEYNYGRKEKILNQWRSRIPFYSVTFGGGIHLIDLAKFFLKKKAVSVIGAGNKIVTKNTKFRFNDFTTGIVKFQSGVIMNVISNFGCEIPHHHCIKIFAKNKTFIQDYKNAKIFSSRKKSSFERLNINYRKKAKTKVLESFIDSILTNKKPLVTKEDVLDVMAISLTLEKSIKTGRWEKVKY